LPPAELKSTPKVWALPAGIGAFIGACILAPITSFVLGSKEAGLLFGAPLGAVGLVHFLAFLSTQSLTSSLPFPFSWIIRPHVIPPSRTECIDCVTDQIKRFLIHDADLVLALCWAHPDRWIQQEEKDVAVSNNEPLSVYEALGTLRAALQQKNVNHQEVCDVAEELLQRFEDEGFEWKVVEEGTPYDESLNAYFQKAGVIEPGQQVRTLREALLRKGVLIRPGLIGRIRS
jgi:hypothetical protein